MPSWPTTLLVIEWLVRLVMLPVVVLRKPRPAVSLAWLTVIFFVPWVGLAAYLLIGENRLGRRRIRRHAEFASLLPAAADRPGVLHEHVVSPDVGPDHEVLIHVAQRLGGLPILGGNRVELLDDAEQVIDELVKDIDAARDHVHLLFYIFAPDDAGRRMTDALIRATGRGVKCRLMVDAVGSRRLLRTLSWELSRTGVEVVSALPANLLRRRFARLDLRNHRKLAVIDGRVGYAGSQNVIRPDYGKAGVGPWQDLMARITGPTVSHLQTVFVDDWSFETGQWLEGVNLFPEPEPRGHVAIQAVPSGPNHPTAILQDLVIEALHAARREVIITTPYFVPDEALLVALRLAVLRGVRVDLVVPARSDHPLVDLAGQFYYEQLLRVGVHVHLHRRGLLHAKTMTADEGFAILGSANFDVRSFYLNFELNLLLYDRDATEQLRRSQHRYIAESQELEPLSWQSRTTVRRLAQGWANLLSPLL